jgi:hypothetical protein
MDKEGAGTSFLESKFDRRGQEKTKETLGMG